MRYLGNYGVCDLVDEKLQESELKIIQKLSEDRQFSNDCTDVGHPGMVEERVMQTELVFIQVAEGAIVLGILAGC